MNVYEATRKRIEFILKEFEHVVVSFSGGKDSGVMLNITLQVAEEIGMLNKLTVYHMDYEAQYQYTTEYVERVFKSLPEEVRKAWVCLPIQAQCATSMHQNHWLPWNKEDKDIWVRDMPDDCINEDNYPFDFDFHGNDYEFNEKIGQYYGKKEKTAFLIGIRMQESFHRYTAVRAEKTLNRYKGKRWTVETKGYVKCYPVFDWDVEDIWIANGKFQWNYNKLYDLYYQAGLTLPQMRVASPFNDCATESLKLYKVIDPNNWGKMVGRVNGVNFAGLYGGTTAMGWKSIKLPDGHTWKSYMYFLLDTLPEEVKQNYLNKLEVSKKSWLKGGAREEHTIRQLEEEGAPVIRTGEKSNRGLGDKEIIRFEDYLDDTGVDDFTKIPTYKRMCICIMKNDHLCKYMGFAPTKYETKKRTETIAKYKNLCGIK